MKRTIKHRNVTSKKNKAVRSEEATNISSQPDHFKVAKVSKKRISKWKPLKRSTREFVENLMKHMANTVLASEDGILQNREANHILREVQTRIHEKLKTIKAPDPPYDYSSLPNRIVTLEKQLTTLYDKHQLLEAALEEEEKEVSLLTAELKTMRRTSGKDEIE